MSLVEAAREMHVTPCGICGSRVHYTAGCPFLCCECGGDNRTHSHNPEMLRAFRAEVRGTFQHEGPPAEGKKASNPKDIIGAGKAPLELVPDTLRVAASMAFLEGALKYGRFNWRLAGVRASIYKAALDRHMASWWNGEDIDAQSGLPHLWKAAACIAILIDSKEAGKLTDDRPPALDLTAMIDGLEKDIARLKALHADKSPHQCTIADGTPLAVPPSVAPGCGGGATVPQHEDLFVVD